MPVHESEPDIEHISETDSTDDSDDENARTSTVADAVPAVVCTENALAVQGPGAADHEERNDCDYDMDDNSSEEEIPLRVLRDRASRQDSAVPDHDGPYVWEMFARDTCEEEGQTISELDAATEELSHCELCFCSLGPCADDVDSRAFRCCECVLSVQCETCCAQTHLRSEDHTLQEWDNVAREWGPSVSLREMLSTMAKICAACEMEVAARDAMLSEGTFMCTDCGPKLYCQSCCMKEHRRKPLHRVQIWEGGWKATTLADEGLIHHLGHQGQPCLWPLQPPAEVMVMCNGPQAVILQFCGCGNFEPGRAGEWSQIRANGWFRAGLVHPRVCAAFRVMSDQQEALYAGNELDEAWDAPEL
ncbi:hypothetical protein DFH06DRAFT_1315842 [Mycena polygramma]|nr:hypothetical protein DFH06DRAFT_1315842 [Mycena polygramma]